MNTLGSTRRSACELSNDMVTDTGTRIGWTTPESRKSRRPPEERERFKRLHAELAARLHELVRQVGPNQADVAGQVQFIRTVTQGAPQAIAVSANDPKALAPSLQGARSQAVKVVSFDSDVAPDARDVFINQVESAGIGRTQIQIIGRQIGCEGEIAVISAPNTATNQNAWIEFMKDELTEPGYENIELVEVVYGDDVSQTSYDKTLELLTAYPDLKGIDSPTSVGVVAAAPAFEAEGRTM